MDLKILFVLLYFSATWTNAFLLRNNVVFKKLSDVHTSKSRWKLTLVEDISDFEVHTTTAMVQVTTLQMSLRFIRAQMSEGTIKPWIEELDQMIEDYSSLQSEISEVVEMGKELRKLESTPGNFRKKRSLIPLIGRLTSFLFGTVSEGDLNSVKRNIHRLSNNQNRLVHVLNESLTLMNISH